MTYTTRTERDGRTTIITPAGNVARMTDCEPFITTDVELAAESLAYLNQKVDWAAGAKPKGTSRMKSMWGVI